MAKSKKQKEYTAYINPQRRMDIHTSSPKVLLMEVHCTTTDEAFREHTWTNIDSRLNKYLQSDESIKISFTADVTKYVGSDGTKKKSLTKLRNIKAV